jgi:hypothetical protein
VSCAVKQFKWNTVRIYQREPKKQSILWYAYGCSTSAHGNGSLSANQLSLVIMATALCLHISWFGWPWLLLHLNKLTAQHADPAHGCSNLPGDHLIPGTMAVAQQINQLTTVIMAAALFLPISRLLLSWLQLSTCRSAGSLHYGCCSTSAHGKANQLTLVIMATALCLHISWFGWPWLLLHLNKLTAQHADPAHGCSNLPGDHLIPGTMAVAQHINQLTTVIMAAALFLPISRLLLSWLSLHLS